eukprot:5802175-Lingulodinium_polyedra.AAC.1
MPRQVAAAGSGWGRRRGSGPRGKPRGAPSGGRAATGPPPRSGCKGRQWRGGQPPDHVGRASAAWRRSSRPQSIERSRVWRASSRPPRPRRNSD